MKSVLSEAKGAPLGGDPTDYRDDVSLYRFIGDVYHDGALPLGVLPQPGGGA